MSIGLDFEKAIETDYFRSTLKVGYSITSKMEIMLSAPYLSNFQGVTNGAEDLFIGIKQNFFGENRYGPSIAYLLMASFPSGEDTFTTDGSAGAGLIISKKIGPFTGHINFIYAEPFDDAYDEQMELILGMDFKAAHDIDIIAELFMVDSYYSDGFETIEGRLGYRIRSFDNMYTVLGAGYEFQNRDPEFRLMASFNFVLSGTDE
ncbi:MAG: hypothetical protein JSV21_09485 [Nitrospirota bacterium]|nr:MAG: hypothetical protein JSV21_09485 [Nitrospirota bacterium]